jgi:hypothetical protein
MARIAQARAVLYGQYESHKARGWRTCRLQSAQLEGLLLPYFVEKLQNSKTLIFC